MPVTVAPWFSLATIEHIVVVNSDDEVLRDKYRDAQVAFLSKAEVAQLRKLPEGAKTVLFVPSKDIDGEAAKRENEFYRDLQSLGRRANAPVVKMLMPGGLDDFLVNRLANLPKKKTSSGVTDPNSLSDREYVLCQLPEEGWFNINVYVEKANQKAKSSGRKIFVPTIRKILSAEFKRRKADGEFEGEPTQSGQPGVEIEGVNYTVLKWKPKPKVGRGEVAAASRMRSAPEIEPPKQLLGLVETLRGSSLQFSLEEYVEQLCSVPLPGTWVSQSKLLHYISTQNGYPACEPVKVYRVVARIRRKEKAAERAKRVGGK